MPIAVIPMAAEFHWSFVQRSLVLSSFAYGYILTQVGLGAVRVRIGVRARVRATASTLRAPPPGPA